MRGDDSDDDDVDRSIRVLFRILAGMGIAYALVAAALWWLWWTA